jgi:hypothetical protein
MDQATVTNPYSRGGLLPLHGGVDGGDAREVGDVTRGDSGSIFPSNIRWNSLPFCGSCFSAASLRERVGGSLYSHIEVKLRIRR